MKSIKRKLLMRRHYQWLFMSVIAFILVGMEVVEHAPVTTAYLEADFVTEVFLMGIVLPLGGGTMLSWMSHSMVQRMPGRLFGGITCVLIIENETLGQLIKHLLSREPDLHVVGIKALNEMALRNAVRHYHPNVLVLDQSVDFGCPSGLPTLIGEFPNLRLVMVNAENDWVKVHDMRQIHISGGQVSC